MAAEAYIARLGARGIEYVFANAGTDFAPIVEALSQTRDAKVPRFMTVPHENVAMAMAHGYYRVSGKPAAVMVHVTVGTANAINGIINAARDNIPLLLAAGRTPLTETGSIASRSTRAACCANTSNGTTSCAADSRWKPWSTARSTSP
jgi:acetolactate synthase-1/2/3 large subunit